MFGIDDDYDDDIFDPDGPLRRRPPPTPEEQIKIDALMARVRRPLGPGDPRRHHFIPVSFLKRFADKSDHLEVLNVADHQHRSRHVRDIAVWKDLYTSIDEEVGETVAVEKLLAEVDGLGANAIRTFDWGLMPQGASRASLVTWIAMLAVRDPFTRRAMEVMADQTFKLDLVLMKSPDIARRRLAERLGREPTSEELEGIVTTANELDKFEVTPHQNDFIKMMLDTGSAMYPVLLQRRMTVMRYSKPGLCLCDRPLVLYQAPENRQPWMGVGIANADEIWLPLNRKLLLVLHHNPQIPEAFVDLPAELGLEDVNRAIVLHAQDEVYAHAEDMPSVAVLEMPDPERPILQVSGPASMDTHTDGVNMPPRRKRHRRYSGKPKDR